MYSVMTMVKAVFQVIFAILFLLLAQVCCNATNGLTTANLIEGLQQVANADNTVLLWGSVVILQLAVMRWLGGVWNVIFSLLSIALMVELVAIAGGVEAAVTAPLYAELKGMGLADITKLYPAAYWLIPTLWLLACLSARDQVRVFITAVVCYLLWLLLTWLGAMGTSTWLSMGEPAPEQLADIARANPWLPSAVPGFFLLVYAELTAIFEACLPHRKKDKAPKKETPATENSK